jgi:hypothetical protein
MSQTFAMPTIHSVAAADSSSRSSGREAILAAKIGMADPVGVKLAQPSAQLRTENIVAMDGLTLATEAAFSSIGPLAHGASGKYPCPPLLSG